ncbi:hypothetical protein TWF718_001396 [Orbilia javanica]|uniref:Uncharacterized protein n=1 Tax=Orbilia javanica TaxID=47235 RepID=A0AAN8NDS9_9PEZI
MTEPTPPIKLPPPLTTEEVEEAIKYESRFPTLGDHPAIDIIAAITNPDRNNNGYRSRSRSGSRTPGRRRRESSSVFYKIALENTVDRSDAYWMGAGKGRKVVGSRSNVNDGLEKHFSTLGISGGCGAEGVGREELQGGSSGSGSLQSSIGNQSQNQYPTNPASSSSSSSSSNPSSNSKITPETLSMAFTEISYTHQNFRIFPMSPLTHHTYSGRGYTPTSEFIVYDQNEPAEIIRTEGGWWAWDLKGDYVCFVTADDARFVEVLMEFGERWGEAVEGRWEAL